MDGSAGQAANHHCRPHTLKHTKVWSIHACHALPHAPAHTHLARHASASVPCWSVRRHRLCVRKEKAAVVCGSTMSPTAGGGRRRVGGTRVGRGRRGWQAPRAEGFPRSAVPADAAPCCTSTRLPLTDTHTHTHNSTQMHTCQPSRPAATAASLRCPLTCDAGRRVRDAKQGGHRRRHIQPPAGADASRQRSHRVDRRQQRLPAAAAAVRHAQHTQQGSSAGGWVVAPQADAPGGRAGPRAGGQGEEEAGAPSLLSAAGACGPGPSCLT